MTDTNKGYDGMASDQVEQFARAVMVWGRPHLKHIVAFSTLCEAIEAALRASQPPEQAGRAYLVWSNEHQAWWKPEHCGYTKIIANAGRYSRDEALRIAGTRDGGWHPNKGNPDEIAIPEEDAIDQYASITAAQAGTEK